MAGRLARVPIRRRRSTHRPRALVAIAVMAAIFLGAAGVSAFTYSNLKDQAGQLQAQITVHLQAGQTELQAAKASLKLATTSHDQAMIAQANVHFIGAKNQFMVARQIADSSDLLSRMEALPEIGNFARSRHAAVAGIADMGIAVSDAGRELSALDAQLIKPAGTKGQEGRTLLTTLNQTHLSVAKVRDDFVRAAKAAAAVDASVLPASQRAAFASARDSITSALAAMDEFERLVPVITDVLGGNGPRTYLIEQVNPAELRPGGGFMGTYSVLRADHGTLGIIKSGNAFEFAPDPRPGPGQYGYVTPPGPFREYILIDKGWSYHDSNFFPDFPANVQAAKRFAEPRLGMTVDGVIAMDYYTVVALLGVTGPIPLPGYGITVDASNFVTEVIQRELVSGDLSHKALTAALAGPLMLRVSTLPADKWPLLLASLNDLASARHLQAYFNNGLVEKEMDRIRWSGTMNPSHFPDYMMAVEANLGASKANYFVTRRFTVELARSGDTLYHKVTVGLVNNANWSLHPNESYRAYERLYVADTASTGGTTLRPTRYGTPAPPAGTKMMDGWFPFLGGYGSSAEGVFEYSTPWKADARGQDQIYFQKQPGSDARTADRVDVIWHDGSGHTFKTTGDLAQDRVIAFSARGVAIMPAPKAQATLPSLSFG